MPPAATTTVERKTLAIADCSKTSGRFALTIAQRSDKTGFTVPLG